MALPGHGFSLQYRVCTSDPEQSLPPNAGGGLSQVLNRSCIPPPHESEQDPHKPHCDHLPSTVDKNTFVQPVFSEWLPQRIRKNLVVKLHRAVVQYKVMRKRAETGVRGAFSPTPSFLNRAHLIFTWLVLFSQSPYNLRARNRVLCLWSWKAESPFQLTLRKLRNDFNTESTLHKVHWNGHIERFSYAIDLIRGIINII